MMCQADDGNLGEDGVAPEGALQSGDGGEAKSYGEHIPVRCYGGWQCERCGIDEDLFPYGRCYPKRVKSSDEEPALAGDTVPAASTEASLTDDDPVQWLRMVGELVENHGGAEVNGYFVAADELARLRAENQSLREALNEAADDIASWGAYASEYFRDKWDLDGCVAGYRAIAAQNANTASLTAESTSDATSTTKDT